MTDRDSPEYVLAAARELYARTIYSHKVHEKDREMWSDKTCRMNYINIGLVSTTTVLAIVSAVLPQQFMLILTALSAAATTGFVLWQANFDPVGKENRHRTTAKELLWIREQLLLLIVRCHNSTDHVTELHRSLDSLMEQLTTAYKFAPDTSPEAYAHAQAALKKNEEFTFSDQEIDLFLPVQLRKNQAGKS